MRCPQCEFENPEGMKFCGECGTKLERTCPKCNFINPPKFKFCGECGQNLNFFSRPTHKKLSLDDKLDKIKRYLPKGLTEKILSQKDRIEGERKQVTVMFCDMKGFTPFVEDLGPEEAYAIMDQVYEALIHKVHDYEGTVNEMTGDGIMALFGAPVALEDAPQRAIRSSLSIHREMAKFSDTLKQEKKDLPSIKMRIGIHIGPVVMGTLGNDLRVEFKVVGETVNLASRLEGLAEPGTTYVSDDLFKLTEGFFRFEAFGKKIIKGKEKPVNVYRVITPITRRTRFDVSAERGLTPFVGRRKELELLLDGFERSKEGRGQAVSIISEAGIGKSRLLYEFRKSVVNENITFLEGRCLSYSKNIAYHSIVDVLRATFDIEDNDPDQVIENKISKYLQFFKIDVASSLPYLMELLSVKKGLIESMTMSPEARKDKTLQALKRVVLKGAEFRPLIIAIEDLHWMDKSSEDALKELIESIYATRIFLIFTYRLGFIPIWDRRSYHNQVTLNRLSNRESLDLAQYILGNSNIEQQFEELILEKTEGIPFFIEEFIKSLKDLGCIEKKGLHYQISKDIGELSIPSTIHDVIVSRVDNLPEDARELLKIGAAIEREFSHILLKKLTGLPEEEMLSCLSLLKDSELLYERGIYPQLTYIFKHALTRDVVYDSILNRRKKRLHERIANTIEEINKENISDHYGVVAGHYIAAENHDKGAKYSILEAKKYQKVALFKDAIEHQKEGINCLERLPQTEEIQKKIIDARTILALYFATLGNNFHAKNTVEPVLDLALKLDYRKRLPRILTVIGMDALFLEEDYSNGIIHMKDAIKISEGIGDLISLWTAHLQLGLSITFQCEFESALSHLKKCLDLSESAKNSLGIFFSNAVIIQINYLQGDIRLACELGQELSKVVQGSDDILSKAWFNTHYGYALYYKGEFDMAEKFLFDGLSNSQKTSVIAWEGWANMALGDLNFEKGSYGQAENYYIKAIKNFEDARAFPSWANAIRTYLAMTRARTGGLDKDPGLLFEYYKNNKLKVCEGIIARNIGDILMQMDQEYTLKAEGWIKRAIDINTKNGTQWYLATDHVLYANWFKKENDISNYELQLTKAIEIFKKCGADGWRKKYEDELSKN